MRNLHIFDCDGVLLDSNIEKIEVLKNVFISIGAPTQFINWAINEFRSNFGRTRRQHFDAFMKNSCIEEFELSYEKSTQAIKMYGESVESLYKDCKVINETLSYIFELPANEQIFVVSASDQVELRGILPSRIPIIKKENIFGGPLDKLTNIDRVMKITSAENAIFYGDAVQDAKASMAAGITFLGLDKYAADPSTLELFCTKHDLKCISSLSKGIKP
jgi:phosphoglycolate phosphatase-like HAD superfamily hydrolase